MSAQSTMQDKIATVYQCSYKYSNYPTQRCVEFNQGKRPNCKGCKSTVRVVSGHAIVAPWRGDGRYSLEDAVKVFSSWAAAERYAMKVYNEDNSSDLVARFILG